MKLVNKDFLPVFDLVSKVGSELVKWYSDPDLRRLHSKKNFKTEADRRAHEILFQGLSTLYPGVTIISEEDSAHANNRAHEYWLIDPIDGTASWYDGFDGYVSQAAFIKNGKPKFGIIHCPRRSLTWSAERGCGGFLNNQSLPRLQPRKSIKFIDNTSMPHGITKWCMSELKTTNYLECGSLGLKSALVADGTADVFIKDVVVRDWDIAPVHILLDEIGGCISLRNGDDYEYSGSYEKPNGFIVARDKQLLKQVLMIQEFYPGDSFANL
jgi:3'(2'), 5'-bisphosphate nucleotidase